MENLRAATHSGKEALFNRLDKLSGTAHEFTVVELKVSKVAIIKMLLDRSTQLVVEAPAPNFRDILKGGGTTELLFYKLFTALDSHEKPSMTDLMYEAKPVNEKMQEFFTPPRRSIYDPNHLVGTNAGMVVIGVREGNRFRVGITDAADSGMTGTYELEFTDEKRKGSYGRDALVIKMSKAPIAPAIGGIQLR